MKNLITHVDFQEIAVKGKIALYMGEPVLESLDGSLGDPSSWCVIVESPTAMRLSPIAAAQIQGYVAGLHFDVQEYATEYNCSDMNERVEYQYGSRDHETLAVHIPGIDDKG